MFIFDSGYCECVTMKNICWEMKQRKMGAKSWFDLGIPGKSSSHFTTVVAACQCIHYTVLLVRGVGSTTTLSMYVPMVSKLRLPLLSRMMMVWKICLKFNP